MRSIRPKALALLVIAAGVVAGCGKGGDDAPNAAATPAAPQATAAPASKPEWVPRRLRDRFAARGPHEPGCGFFANSQRTTQYDFYVSGAARCRTGLLVLADFDAHLSKSDLSAPCDYRLCASKLRTYRGYRCRLVHQFDDAYEVVCARGDRKISIGFGG